MGCGKWGTYFCLKCQENITQKKLVCPSCERAAIEGKTHPLCIKKYGLDGLWSLGTYQGSLRQAIKKFKYKFVQEIALVLVDLLIEYWAKYSASFLEELKKDQGKGWVIVPVPLHPKREKYRGFNQSAKIAQLLARKLGLEYQEVLKRVHYTKPQVGLKSWQRKKNINNAFTLNTVYKILNTNILLVDDVWTTGSTLKECCYVLKRGGAKKVWAITLAR